MIDLSDKTFAKLLADMLARVPSDLNKREGSLIRTSLAAAAWTIEGLYLDMGYIQKQAYGETATTEYLDYIAEEAGLTRKEAVPAIREGRFNIAPPVGTQFMIMQEGGNVYYTLTKAAESSPDSSYPDTPFVGELTCDTAGAIGNVYSGTLGVVGFVNGLTDALLIGTIIPGEDVETDDSLRARYLSAIGRVEFAGNINAYKKYLLAQTGVGAVQIYPVWNGPGTVLISVVDEDYLPVTSAKLSELQTLVCPPDAGSATPSANGYGIAPIGAVVTMTRPIQYNLTITADIVIKSSSSKTIEEIQADAEQKLNEYILDQCKSWGEMADWNLATYSITIYYNKVLSVLNNLDSVEVATSVMVNGDRADIVLQQQPQVDGQRIPHLYSVTLTQA